MNCRPPKTASLLENGRRTVEEISRRVLSGVHCRVQSTVPRPFESLSRPREREREGQFSWAQYKVLTRFVNRDRTNAEPVKDNECLADDDQLCDRRAVEGGWGRTGYNTCRSINLESR